MNITKKIISFEISSNLDINKDISGTFLDRFLDLVKIEALNKSVKINKFGTFTYINTKTRKGRNPKTLKEYEILPVNKLKFKASSKTKDLLN